MKRFAAAVLLLALAGLPTVAKPPPKPDLDVSVRLRKSKVSLLDRIPIEITVTNKGKSTVEVPPLRLADDAVTIVLKDGEKEFRLRRIYGTWSGEQLTRERVDREPLRRSRKVKEMLEFVAIRPGTYDVTVELRGVTGLDPKEPPTSRAAKLTVTPPPEGKALRVKINTSLGVLFAELDPDDAYNSCHEFVLHAQDGYWGNGMTFYRVIEGFMAQTGSPNNGTGGYGYSIPAEFSEMKHVRGVLSMARKAHVDSADGQFFIMHQDNAGLDGKYTAFGRLTSGIEIVDRIAKVEKGPNPFNPKEISKPRRRIELRGVEVSVR